VAVLWKSPAGRSLKRKVGRCEMKKVIIYTDGAARNNPGPAGIGVLVTDSSGRVLSQVSRYIGETTNNVAEYIALIQGLLEAAFLGAVEVEAFCDSELMVKQLQGLYRVKNEKLQPLYTLVRLSLDRFEKFTISHISREKNKAADRLANAGIDRRV